MHTRRRLAGVCPRLMHPDLLPKIADWHAKIDGTPPPNTRPESWENSQQLLPASMPRVSARVGTGIGSHHLSSRRARRLRETQKKSVQKGRDGGVYYFVLLLC